MSRDLLNDVATATPTLRSRRPRPIDAMQVVEIIQRILAGKMVPPAESARCFLPRSQRRDINLDRAASKRGSACVSCVAESPVAQKPVMRDRLPFLAHRCRRRGASGNVCSGSEQTPPAMTAHDRRCDKR